jgi:2-polyprenyl-3-methyl-5-hydroxy-6-metoxy-1,4-benzoquinol methylase
MGIYTTEITSDSLNSDNPLHQRLLAAYYLALPYITGDLLEVGCGEGRGIEVLQTQCKTYMAIDKIGAALAKLSERYPTAEFKQMHIPPFSGLDDNSFDTVISFQVIEHIKDDRAYLREIHRVLRPGGTALITTPNITFTLTRNPWHVREYLSHELLELAKPIFKQVEMKGIAGSEKVMAYYQQNKQSVKKITRFDVFNLQYKLPASWLRIPYDILNRLNRQNLNQQDQALVAGITYQDYYLVDHAENGLDLFGVFTK